MTRRTSHRNPATIRLRGRGPSPAVERLLRDFAEASFPNPLGSAERNERVLKGIDALVRLEPDGRKVFVAEVRALRPRQGVGTRAMQFLTDLADKHGVQLALFPHPFGTAQMEVGALVNFYRRFGFQYADEDGEAGDEMVRFPRESNPRRRVRRNPHPQTDTAAFKRWFGASKVVDAEGNPLVVYHGTSATFDTFDLAWSWDGGFHFGTAEAATNRIADGAGLDPKGWALNVSPSILPVYLSIKRPLRLNYDPVDEETWAEGIGRAKDEGYDGIVYPNAIEGGESWVAFSPTQIKSATGNRGTFDPEDPNIMHNPRRRAAPRRALRFVRPPRRVVRRNGLARAIHATLLTPAVAAFMAEWNKRDMDTVFADMGVRVDVLVNGGDFIELELIEAESPRKGAGSLALRTLLDLVDKHHLGVTLNAMPFSRWLAPTIPLDDLVRFYQRFGFRLDEDEDEDEDEEPESYLMSRSRRNPHRRTRR